MISPEELSRIKKIARDYQKPPHPRTGMETIAMYDMLNDMVMRNLKGILDAASVGVKSKSK